MCITHRSQWVLHGSSCVRHLEHTVSKAEVVVMTLPDFPVKHEDGFNWHLFINEGIPRVIHLLNVCEKIFSLGILKLYYVFK